MKEPRRHHHVPRYLLRGWANADEQVFALRRPADGAFVRPFLTKIDNVFSQRDLYAVERDNGSLDQSVETKFYGMVDNTGSELRRQVLERVRVGAIPKMTRDARRTFLDVFIRNTVTRSPKAFDGPVIRFEMEEAKEKAVEKAAAAGASIEVQRALLDDPHVMDRVKRNAVAWARSRSGSEALDQIERLGILYVRIDRPNCQFVVSDLLMDGAGRIDRDENLGPHELWVPLAPDVAIRLNRTRDGGAVIDPNSVRRINRRLYRQSTTVAASSPKLLDSLARELDRARWDAAR